MFGISFMAKKNNRIRDSANRTKVSKHFIGKHLAYTGESGFEAPPEILVLIDESGDLGDGTKSPKPITMTATVNSNYTRLDDIAERYPKNTRPVDAETDELKYHSSSDEVRQAVLVDFMNTSPQIYSVILKKSDFGRMSQCQAYIKMVEEALDDIMEDPNVRACRSKTLLVFDEHRCLSEKLAKQLTGKAAIKHGLDPTRFRATTDSSQNCLALQVHDFASGAIGGEYRRKGGHDDRTPTPDYRIIKPRSKERFISRNERVTVAPDLKTNRLPARPYFRHKGFGECPRAANQQWTRTDLLSPDELAVRITYIRR